MPEHQGASNLIVSYCYKAREGKTPSFSKPNAGLVVILVFQILGGKALSLDLVQSYHL